MGPSGRSSSGTGEPQPQPEEPLMDTQPVAGPSGMTASEGPPPAAGSGCVVRRIRPASVSSWHTSTAVGTNDSSSSNIGSHLPLTDRQSAIMDGHSGASPTRRPPTADGSVGRRTLKSSSPARDISALQKPYNLKLPARRASAGASAGEEDPQEESRVARAREATEQLEREVTELELKLKEARGIT
jgi:hypothetical protein